MAKLLIFVKKNHPILREVMPIVDDFNDPNLKQIIEDMCFSIMPEQLAKAKMRSSAAGMAANQWGIKKRVFIYTPDGSGPDKRLEVMLNPSYVPLLNPGEATPRMIANYEGCFSIPLTAGLINRYETILATYYTPEGKKVERLLTGYDARVFQHETDHLNGKLFDGKLDHFDGPECLERFIFKNNKEMDAFWEGVVRPARRAK